MNEENIIDLEDIEGQLISQTFDDIYEHLNKNRPSIQSRLENYRSAFEEEFLAYRKAHEHTSDEEYLYEIGFNRGIAESFTLLLMRVPLMLYAINLNGPAIVELHGLVEQFIIEELATILSSSKERTQVVRKRLLEQKSLRDLAQILVDLQIWDKDDVKFLEKLCGLRNAIAHKNAERISKLVYSGKKISFLGIDMVMTDFDVVPYMIRSLRLIAKLTLYEVKVMKKLEEYKAEAEENVNEDKENAHTLE